MSELTYPFAFTGRRAVVALIAGILSVAAAGLLAFPALGSPVGVFSAQIILTLAFAAMACVDRRTGIVPPGLSLPLLSVAALAAFARFGLTRDLAVVPYWLGILLLYRLNAFGGGDAKLVLAQFGLWPDARLLQWHIAVQLGAGIPLLVWKHRRALAHPRALAGEIVARLITRQVVPTDAELEQGERATWMFALAGVLYVWLAV